MNSTEKAVQFFHMEGTSMLAHHILKYRKRRPCSTLLNYHRVQTAGSVMSECIHLESNGTYSYLRFPERLKTIHATYVVCVC